MELKQRRAENSQYDNAIKFAVGNKNSPSLSETKTFFQSGSDDIFLFCINVYISCEVRFLFPSIFAGHSGLASFPEISFTVGIARIIKVFIALFKD